MADEKPVVLAAPPVVVEPVVPVVEAAPVVAAEIAPAPEATIVEAQPSLLESLEVPGEVKPEIVAEKPPIEVKPEEPPAEIKPEEKPAEVDAKPPEEVKPPEPVKPEPFEYKYEVPETIKMDDAIRGELHAAMDEFRADPNLGATKLLALHEQRMQAYDQFLRQDQFRQFNDTKQQWRTQAMADEQIGGSAWNTSKGAIARMRDEFVSASPRGSDGWKADSGAFIEMLNLTGAGDHPAMLKFLHNVARRFDEPAPLPIANVKTVPETAPRGNPLHDNPRSQGRQ